MTDDEVVTKDEEGIVLRWRMEQFLALGFDLLTAQLLTQDKDIEVRRAEKILKSGATHYAASRILL